MNVETLVAIVAGLGDLRVALAGSLLTVGFLTYLGRCDIARCFILGIAVTVAVTVLTKLLGLALEHRAVGALIGSPSGHTSVGTVFVGSLALLLSHKRSTLIRAISLTAAALIVLVIAHSRIANDAHTRFEVLEGIVIGLVGLVPLAALRPRRSGPDVPDTVPASPLLLMIAALVALRAIVPVPDLDTETIMRGLATLLLASHH